MEYEWDLGKADSNLRKHKLSFEAAVEIFGDPALLVFDTSRASDGERRVKVIGMIEGRLITLIYTMRGDVMRIISARRANRAEAKRYG